MQVLQHILALQPPRLHDGQDAFHEATAATLLQPKLRFRHSTARRSSRSMRLLVGSTPSTRANVHSAGSNASRFSQNAATVVVLAEDRAFEQDPVQPVHDRLQLALQLCPRGLALLERLPRGKDLFDDSAPRSAHRLARAAAVHDLLKIAFQVGPAHLPTLRRHGGRRRPSGRCTGCPGFPRPATPSARRRCAWRESRRRPPSSWPPPTANTTCRAASNWSRRRA